MISATRLKRTFQINGTVIPCPMPDASLDDAVRSLATRYPQFRHTHVYESDGVVEGDTICYTLVLPPPKSNG